MTAFPVISNDVKLMGNMRPVAEFSEYPLCIPCWPVEKKLSWIFERVGACAQAAQSDLEASSWENHTFVVFIFGSIGRY
jgi:hypothetical protein